MSAKIACILAIYLVWCPPKRVYGNSNTLILIFRDSLHPQILDKILMWPILNNHLIQWTTNTRGYSSGVASIFVWDTSRTNKLTTWLYNWSHGSCQFWMSVFQIQNLMTNMRIILSTNWKITLHQPKIHFNCKTATHKMLNPKLSLFFVLYFATFKISIRVCYNLNIV